MPCRSTSSATLISVDFDATINLIKSDYTDDPSKTGKYACTFHRIYFGIKFS